MARKNAGKIMILPRGDWDATVAYSTLDLVHIPNAASYLAIKNVPAGTPVSDTNYWQEMSNYEHVIENFILSQDTQPTSEYNRIWLKPSSDDLVLAELADVQEVANDVNDLKSQLYPYNSVEMLGMRNREDKTLNGVTYTWSGNEQCDVDTNGGASTAISYYNVYGTESIPDFALIERKCYLKYKTSDPNVRFRIVFKQENGTNISTVIVTSDKSIDIPANAEKWTCGLHVLAGVTINHATVTKMQLFSALTNSDLTEITQVAENSYRRIYAYDDMTHGGYWDLGSTYTNYLFFRDTQRVHSDSLYSRLLIPVKKGDTVQLKTSAGSVSAKP